MRLVAIGDLCFEARGEFGPDFKKPDRCLILGPEDEAKTLGKFWDLTRGEMGRTTPLIGFNIFGFDLPFLIRRSWKQRVPVPWGLRRGRYWDNQLVDLREAWQMGDRQARGSLDCVARHLGVGAKMVTGKPSRNCGSATVRRRKRICATTWN